MRYIYLFHHDNLTSMLTSITVCFVQSVYCTCILHYVLCKLLFSLLFFVVYSSEAEISFKHNLHCLLWSPNVDLSCLLTAFTAKNFYLFLCSFVMTSTGLFCLLSICGVKSWFPSFQVKLKVDKLLVAVSYIIIWVMVRTVSKINTLTAEAFSETTPFMYLSNHVFRSQ